VTFDFEIVQYSEVISSPLAQEIGTALPNLTASHSDGIGMSQMRGFFESRGVNEPGPTLLSQAYKWISEVSPTEVSRYVDSATALRGGVKLLTGL